MAASKQFEGFYVPNSTQVPDDLFDKYMAELSGAELKVLLYIIRRTFGFKRQQDAISISQLVNGITKRNGEVLDQGTGLSRVSAISAAKSLEARGFIERMKKQSAEKGDETTAYSLKIAVLQEKTQAPSPQPWQKLRESQGSGGEYKNYTPPGSTKIEPGGSTETLPGGVQKLNPQDTDKQGFHLRRDRRWSIAYSEELVSSKISATLQSTDRHHGIVGQERCHFQRDS